VVRADPGRELPTAESGAEPLSQLFAQFDALSGHLEELQELYRARSQHVTDREATCARREGELQERENRLSQARQDLAELDAELLDRQAELAQTLELQKAERDDLDRQRAALGEERERQQARENDLNRRRDELACRAAELNARQVELEDQRRALAAERQQLEQDRNEVTAARAALDDRQAELDARSQELDAKQAALARGEQTLEQQREECTRSAAAFREREQALAERIDMLTTREAALASFRDTLAQIATALTDDPAPPATTPAPIEGAPSAGDAAQAARGGSAETAPAPGSKGQLLEAEDEPEGEGTLPAAEPVHENAVGADHLRVEERSLEPEVLKKLYVLRRLTGGRVPDAELLQRIERERHAAPRAPARSSRSKHRWWRGGA